MTMTTYTQIDVFNPGDSIDIALDKLKNYSQIHNENVCNYFNGKMIYSTETIDEAYKKITGHDKKEFEEIIKKEIEDNKKRHNAFLEKKDEIYKEIINKSTKLIDEESMPSFQEDIKALLSSNYEDYIPNCLIEILEIFQNDLLNEDEKLLKAKNVFNSQSHSGNTAYITLELIKKYNSLGDKFCQLLK